MNENNNEVIEKIVKRCKKALRESYFNSSYLEKIVNTEDAEKGMSQTEFLKLGHWKSMPLYLFEDLARFPDPIFRQYGSSIARGEIKHLISKILKDENICVFSTDKVDIDILSSKIKEFRKRNSLYDEIILFTPIEYFMKIHVEWPRSSKKIKMIEGQFYIDGLPVKIYWSNKYNTFTDFIICDKNFATWTYKPSVKKRLKVELSKSIDPLIMELKAETVFLFEINEPNLVTIIRPKTLPSRNK